MTPRLVLLTVALAVSGCGLLPSPLGTPPVPEARVAVPVSSVHYRGYASADALAEALRWRPGAPVWVSAHRGGPRPGLPENSLPALDHALNYAPALLEVDVRRAADGALVLLHDDTLDRTTTGTGALAEHALADLRRLRLEDERGALTSFRIPTLGEALAWAQDRGVLLLDVKPGVTPERLAAAVQAADAGGRVVVIVTSLDDLIAFRRVAPELVYSVSTETVGEIDEILAAGVPPDRLIAFGGVGDVDPAVVERWHALGVRVQVGTFGAIDRAAAEQSVPTAYDGLLALGVDVLSTDNVPAAAIAARTANLRRPR